VKVEITKQGKYRKEYETVDHAVLRIGRNPGKPGLVLAGHDVLQCHCEIAPAADTDGAAFVLTVTPGARVLSGATEIAGEQRVGPGTRLQIAAYKLELRTGEEGVDLEVIVTLPDEPEVTDEQRRDEQRRLSPIDYLWLGKRRGAWLLALLIMVGGGAAPAAVFIRSLVLGVPTAPAAVTQIWSPGLVSDAHHAFSDDCTGCHTGPHGRADSITCGGCHTHILGHGSSDQGAQLVDVASCTTCHTEHRGALLAVAGDQVACAQCHQKLTPPASDFGLDHPDFRRLTAGPGSKLDRTLGSLTAQGPETQGFTHRRHLAPAGIAAPNGTRHLVCVDCHRVASDGTTMQPVSMETNCQGCHQLGFLPFPDAHPEPIPHGNAALVERAVIATYVRLGNQVGTRAGGRARPGEQAEAALPDDVEERVLSQSAAALRQIFAGTTCHTCHVVDEPPAGQRFGWKIEPLSIPEKRFKRAVFRHDMHATSAKPSGLAGADAASDRHPEVVCRAPADQPPRTDFRPADMWICLDCHAVGPRTLIEEKTGRCLGPDVRLPTLTTCRGCHAGSAGAPDKVASTCLDCHIFHKRPVPTQPELATLPASSP
jgi:hypothetical protein